MEYLSRLLDLFKRKVPPTETSRKRRAEDTLGCQDAKVLCVEEPNTYGESNISTDLVHWRIRHQEARTGHVIITRWGANANGKENKDQYFHPQRSSMMHFQPNLVNMSTEERNNVRLRSKKKPKEVEKTFYNGGSLSSDTDVVEIPPPQSSCIRNEPVVVNVPVSPEFNRRRDNDVQIIKEQLSASKGGHFRCTTSPPRRPFKAIDPTSSRESSTPIIFSSRRQIVHSPEQSEIETLPSSSSMGNGIGKLQYRTPMLSSDSCSLRKSTLKAMRRAEELQQYNNLFAAFHSDRSQPFKLKEQAKHASTMFGHSPSPLLSSSSRVLNKLAPESISKDICERISLPVEKISKDEPSTSATRHQAEDSDLQFLGQVRNSTKQPIQTIQTDIEEIWAKYAQKQRALDEEAIEWKTKSRLLEERNKQAAKLKKLNDTTEIEESLKSYLRLVEEPIDEKEEKEVPTLPELTADMEAEIDKALNALPDTVLVSAFNLTLKGRDMRTLRPLAWLNDEVINFYMNLLIERGKDDKYPSVHAFNTFFFPKLISNGYDSLKRWTKKVDIFAHDFLLVPVHRGMHWCMAIIDVKEKVIRYYDSMNGRYPQCADALLHYLQKESLDKKKQNFDTTGWEKEHAEGIPQQNNGSDCGMFACMYAEYVSRGVSITFTQDDMPYFRRKAVYEILKAKLLC